MSDTEEELASHSRDASLFEVRPKLVVFPRNSEDVKEVVKYINTNKSKDPSLSLTARAAGSCMSGGPLNESIILDVSRYLSGSTRIEMRGSTPIAEVLPGTYYRDFEVETLKKNLILPCYTASKNLCAIGGMIGNNAAGEKTLLYGKMENYVESFNVVLSDGNEYEIKPLSKGALDAKIGQGDFEGEIYRKIWKLAEENRDEIEKNRPHVSKNSAGYYIWNVVAPHMRGEDPAKGGISESEYFDLTRLLVGSQGTLGIVTSAKLRLVPVKKHSKLFVIFLRDLNGLGDLINEILHFRPDSLESYDNDTLKLALRFFPEILRSMKAKSFLKLLWNFIPEAGMMLTGGIPKLILLVEFTSDFEGEIDKKMRLLKDVTNRRGIKSRITRNESESEKYWTIRRESFNLLRKHIKGKRTAPFVDDVVVEPRFLPEFLPKMRAILDKYKLTYTIAGHAGNGNFHVIPLMDMKDERAREIIPAVSDEVYNLVGKYRGSITAEHNDGIVRTPYLGKMYSSKMLEIFAEIKNIFDPYNIFNPGKKVPDATKATTDKGGTLEYMRDHIARS